MANSTDLIAGVARAADPVKQREAASRLQKLSNQAGAAVSAGAQAADGSLSDWSAKVRLAGADTSRAARIVSSAGGANGARGKSDVYVQFEALLLQNMIEAMMPESSVAVFGSGMAGKVWKSMLAEKVAAEIARTGALGIAKQIAAGPQVLSGSETSTRSKVDDS